MTQATSPQLPATPAEQILSTARISLAGSTNGHHNGNGDGAAPRSDWERLIAEHGGELGRLVADHDWSSTPLGPIESWPESLRSAVEVSLTSRFPILVWWGPELVMLYNDAYRPMLGMSKHPGALGAPGEEVWPEIWPVIGPMLRKVLAGEGATWSADELLMLNRNGYLEECYFTFSYSPIQADLSGGDDTVGGVFCAVTETTERVLGERRLATLAQLAARLGEADDEADVIAAALDVLQTNDADHPVAAIVCDPGAQADASSATTQGDTEPSTEIHSIGDLDDQQRAAVLGLAADVAHTRRSAAKRLGAPPAVTDSPAISPAIALHALPITEPGVPGFTAVLVLAEPSHRPWDTALSRYAALCATHIGTALSGIHELEQERQRADALTELDELKSAFFTNISHELRTPLTLIAGPVRETLHDPDLAEKHRERLRLVERNVTRLARMVDAMLDFDRMEAGRVSPATRALDVGAVLRGLASAFQPAIESGRLAFEVDLPDLPRVAYLDPDMFERIVLNLLSNALKYTPRGTVSLTLRDGSETFDVEVRDTGIGIAAPDLARIFERFERLPRRARARSHEGAGIGLAMVKQLTELMGGQVSVRSAPGRGTTFVVSLPYGEPAVDAPANPSITPRHVEAFLAETLGWEGTYAAPLPSVDEVGSPSGDDESSPAPAQGSAAQRATERAVETSVETAAEAATVRAVETVAGGTPVAAGPTVESDAAAGDSPAVPTLARPRLIIADDSVDMRTFLEDVLADSYELDVVADGDGALAAARRERPDVVLADVMMPGLDGFGLVRALRADPELSEVPVILVSARADERATEVGLGIGADDYIVKPFSVGELKARLAGNLERSRSRLRDAAWRRAVMTALSDPLVITDEQGTVVEVNDAFTDLLGWSMCDGPFPVPHPWWPPDAKPLLCDELEVAVAFGPAEPLRGEFKLVTKDGRDVWVEGSAHHIAASGSTPALVFHSFRDVTREHWSRERRIAAAALSAEFSSAEDLSQVLTAAVAGFAELFDGDSTVRVTAGTEDHVFTAAGPVRGSDVEPAVWQALLGTNPRGIGDGHPAPVVEDVLVVGVPGHDHTDAGPPGEPPDGPPRDEVQVTGLLLAPDNHRADCRAWVQFQRPRYVTTDERIIGDLMAQSFSLAVDRVVAATGFADRESHLAKAIESHRLIGQAIGILIERHRITSTEAFARLKRASQDRNIKLREIASRVIETGAEPDSAE